MKKVMLMTMSLCLAMNVSFAQGPGHHGPHPPHHKHHHKHHPKLNKEAKAALDKFDKETVYPVKKTAHNQLLSQFNAEDLAFLDKKRIEGKNLREEMHTLHKEMRDLKESGKSKEESREIMKTKMGPQKEKMKAFMESMKPFMERNHKIVHATMEGLKANHDEWKVTKRGIIDQYLTAEQKEKMEFHKKKMEEKRVAHPERKGKHRAHHKAMHAVKFVLWDGEMSMPRHHRDCKQKDCPADKKEQTNGNTSSAGQIESLGDAGVMSLNSYPNPAISQTTIIFDLEDVAKNVTLTITDAQGKQMLNKVYNKLDAGSQKLDIDLNKFTSGQYFYTLEVNGTQMTKTLIVNK